MLTPDTLDIIRACSKDETAYQQLVALYESQNQREQRVLEQFPGILVVYDQDLRCQLASGTSLETFNLTPADLEGKTAEETPLYRIHPEIYQRILDGETASEEIVYSDLFLVVQGIPFKDIDGRVEGGMLVAQDVTERKQREQALSESEERFRQAFDYSPIGMALLTAPEGNWLQVNHSLTEMFGYTEAELLAIDFQTVTYPEDLQPDLDMAEKLLRGEIANYQIEKRYFHKQGHIVWTLLSVAVMRDSKGSPTYYISQLYDITELKQKEAALRESEDRYRMLVQHSPDMLFQQDRDLRYTWLINPMPPFTVENTTNISDYNLPLLEEERQQLISIKREILETGIGRRVEIRLSVGETTRYFDCIYMPRYLNEEIIGITAYVRDMTSQKQLQHMMSEKELLRFEVLKEKELSDLKTRMMLRIGHEFRTPLTIIMSSVDLVDHYSDRMTVERRRLHLQKIRNQVGTITEMLDDISIIVKSQHNRISVMPSPVHLKSLCQGLIDDVRFTLDDSHDFQLLMPDREDFNADPFIIRSVLQRLLSNAVKYSAPGSTIQVEGEFVHDGVMLSVNDQGIGIQPEDLKRIYEPFFRGSNIGEVGGIGLGLTIAKSLVELHNGNITVVSQPESDTTFYIWLPNTPPAQVMR